MLTYQHIQTDRLYPNRYNPNVMTEEELAELLAEVQRLGRLPQPIIVRPAGDDFEIVDGEHRWKAAKEAGFSEVICEVIEADDFEAMRQSYKRNQRGTHNPVLLGRMFRQMLQARGLSRRALAEEIKVSEGTIRNNLLYAEAADLRNGYAFENLQVRQVRQYLSLPPDERDVWLDDQLSESEQARLAALEEVIEKGMAEARACFPKMRHALRDIRDRRLYREEYATFDDFCREYEVFSGIGISAELCKVALDESLDDEDAFAEFFWGHFELLTQKAV